MKSTPTLINTLLFTLLAMPAGAANLSAFREYTAAAARDTVVVEVETDDGYATAYCPDDYVVDECDFDDADSCDGTSQGRDYCRADSRDHQTCRIRAYCERRQNRVSIHGSTDDGYKEIDCPRGYRIESCRFERDDCDNTRVGRDYCGADSRDHNRCDFSGVCVD